MNSTARRRWHGMRQEKLLTLRPAQGSLLERKFPEACLLARLDALDCTVGDAQAAGREQ